MVPSLMKARLVRLVRIELSATSGKRDRTSAISVSTLIVPPEASMLAAISSAIDEYAGVPQARKPHVSRLARTFIGAL
jgi:hypothetical protein